MKIDIDDMHLLERLINKLKKSIENDKNISAAKCLAFEININEMEDAQIQILITTKKSEFIDIWDVKKVI